MQRRSRSTLFLMEQLIVIAVFAICAAACLKILTASYFMATDTRDIYGAVRAAENGAEVYKALSGNIAETAQFLGGITNPEKEDSAAVYYDSGWNVCAAETAEYVLYFKGEAAAAASGALRTGELSVEKLSGEEILKFSVAAREDMG